MKQTLHDRVRQGQNAFYNKFNRYPSHLRIGRKFINEVCAWETEHRTDFAGYIRNSYGVIVELDFSERDVFELYAKKPPKIEVKLPNAATTFTYVDNLNQQVIG